MWADAHVHVSLTLTRMVSFFTPVYCADHLHHPLQGRPVRFGEIIEIPGETTLFLTASNWSLTNKDGALAQRALHSQESKRDQACVIR